MATKDALLGITIFCLLLVVIILGVRSSTASARAEEADAMSEVLVETLRAYGYHSALPACRGISPSEYEGLTACLREVKEPSDLSLLFELEDFANYDERDGEGHLIIRNAKGAKAFASENFTFRINNEEVAQGCATPGEIAPGFACRFNLREECTTGDNLEIIYEGKRAFLRTC